ncbi:LysR family transcriptional regulator [Actinoallomurus rhizosphaericola]|uniref:LysR family transcriptional regulator n=1 Tax=Actinoallomurus rhizosphaericola TaxID=2952536 RepID=UPI0020931C7B|nr:LysR family transcriptional regulator [Actinoallomurus rhizosphaericola]MCO5999669.1 LysR family transcriptional regulator [Actinoallomurus rhizosphaericola]
MEVRQLRYFVTVAEIGHFGRAAERLHIVQPAVSKQIAGLERELGLTLFDRSRRQIRLTADGEAFLPHARRALRAIDRAAKAAADLAAGTAGLLHVGSSPGLGRRLEDILTEFRGRHPDVTVDLTTTSSVPDKLAAILTGDLDAAFVPAPPHRPGIAVHHLWDEPLLVAVPAPRAATAADLVTLADLPLARSPREANPGAFDLITAACAAAGFTPRPGPILTSVQDLLAGPIAAGHCWALLPAGSIRADSAAVAFVAPTPPIHLPTALALTDPPRRPLATDLLVAARRTNSTVNTDRTLLS